MGIRVCGLLAVCAGLAIASGVEAGPLTPPGAPSSTYKTLVDVEPRTALYSTGAGIVISQEGSYYLAENLPAYGLQAAIEISAPNVTLDLNGFTITGSTEVGVDNGINIASTAHNTTIYNGTIRDCDSGIIGMSADHVTVRNVRVIDSQSGHGIILDNNAMVIDCHVENVPGNGIDIGTHSTLRGCVIRGVGAAGIVTGSNTQVRETVIDFTGDHGISAGGENMIVDCTINDVAGDGINAGLNSRIEGCAIEGADGDGIDVSSAIIRNTTVNITGVHGMDIGSGTVVEGCNVLGVNTLLGVGNGIEGTDTNKISGTRVSGVFGTGNGIDLWHNNSVIECDVNGAGGLGMHVLDGNQIRACTITDSGSTGIHVREESVIESTLVRTSVEMGIDLDGSRNRVTGCSVADSDEGIQVDANGFFNYIADNAIFGHTTGLQLWGSDNTVVRNSFGNNTTDLVPGSFNEIGPLNKAGVAGPQDNLTE